MSKPIALLCNDDGIHAPGLAILGEALANICEVYIVAPHIERSATSHCITISEPLRLEKLPDRSYSKNVYSANGTPADCVMIGLDKVLPKKPHWVVSGINRGANLGVDTLYSGTVGAAMEAAMHEVKAFAVSSVGRYGDHFHYDTAAQVLLSILEYEHEIEWGKYMMININVPALPFDSLKGITAASVGRLLHDKSFYKNLDPNGKPYYWLGSIGTDFENIPGSDCNLIDAGFATVSALRPSFLDEENHAKLADKLGKIFSNSK